MHICYKRHCIAMDHSVIIKEGHAILFELSNTSA